MKHISIITLDNKCPAGGDGYDKAGYCRDLGQYLYARYAGGMVTYYHYYAITKEQYETIAAHSQNGAETKEEIKREDYTDASAYLGAGYLRGYMVNHGLCFRNVGAICQDGPFLYEDGVLYYHLYYEGKHYAALPNLYKKFVKNTTYREPEGLAPCHIVVDGQEQELCYGKEVTDFDGMEDFEAFLHENKNPDR